MGPFLLLAAIVGMATGDITQVSRSPWLTDYSRHIVHNNGHAFVLTHSSVEVYSVADKTSPVHTATIGCDNTRALLVNGPQMHIVLQQSVVAYNISNPLAPTLLSTTELKEEATGMATQSGTHIFLLLKNGSANKIGIFSKRPFAEVDAVAIDDELPHIGAMLHQDNKVYLSMKQAIHVIKVGESAELSLSATWPTLVGADLSGMAYSGESIYATSINTQHPNIHMINVSTGSFQPLILPPILGNTSPLSVYGIAMQDSKMFLACGGDGVVVLMEAGSNTFNPLHVEPALPTTMATSLHVDAQHIYTAGEDHWSIYSITPTPFERFIAKHGENNDTNLEEELSENEVKFVEMGCFKTNTRFMETYGYGRDLNTPKMCALHCARRKFRFSGVEYKRQCWCGNEIESSMKTIDSECNSLCPGDASQRCGGGFRMNLLQMM
eukprot:TRINITY_DN24636_c0_g1_i1.p1 TRINITY_DN24636_c0_g1~~TRINITY_DN24636_c0_g1_i1.p1  ORF type:complete len:448 (+),score=76.91 TRINITY_DN24636_c0_g1_i1:31-1344(+)